MEKLKILKKEKIDKEWGYVIYDITNHNKLIEKSKGIYHKCKKINNDVTDDLSKNSFKKYKLGIENLLNLHANTSYCGYCSKDYPLHIKVILKGEIKC